MTSGSSIDYEQLMQEAMRGMVRNVLIRIAKSGLPGEHHFYIAFDTQAAGVSISRRLKEKYPDEMTIVLQHRFWDLLVNDERFEVKLTFDHIPERLVVPFTAIRVFYDPSVRYTIQFEDPGFGVDLSEPGGRRGGIDRTGRPTTGERRSRPARKPRSERPTDVPESTASVPATGAPPPIPATISKIEPKAPAASPPLAPAPASGTPPPAPAAAGGSGNANGAQIVSLDKFRKK